MPESQSAQRWSIVQIALVLMIFAGPAKASWALLPIDPGFEQNCGGEPCKWTRTTVAATVTRDTTNPHSGAASMKVQLSSTAVEVRSACITGVTGGVYDASFFYRTPGTGVTQVSGRFNFYASTDCSWGISAQIVPAALPNADGAWHQVSAGGEAPETTRSFLVGMTFNCSSCVGSPNVIFDDILIVRNLSQLIFSSGFEP